MNTTRTICEEEIVQELTDMDVETSGACLVAGWLLLRSLRRVSGQPGALGIDIAPGHWDIIAGLAIAFVGCQGAVESLCALGGYSMHLARQHRLFEVLRPHLHLDSVVPDRIRAIVRAVSDSLDTPYTGQDVSNVN